MTESIPFSYLPQALGLRPGVTAVIGSGGKTSLLRTLADQLSAEGASVVLATSTRIAPFDGMPSCTGADPAELSRLLGSARAVCVGTPAEQGKLAAPAVPFCALARDVDYVLVEADGSRSLPLKAHAAHEPVIPAEATLVAAVTGASGFGQPVRAAAHRPEIFCKLAGCEAGAPATPALVARALTADWLAGTLDRAGDARLRVLVNQVDTPERLEDTCELQRALHVPVLAASLAQQRLWRIA